MCCSGSFCSRSQEAGSIYSTTPSDHRLRVAPGECSFSGTSSLLVCKQSRCQPIATPLGCWNSAQPALQSKAPEIRVGAPNSVCYNCQTFISIDSSSPEFQIQVPSSGLPLPLDLPGLPKPSKATLNIPLNPTLNQKPYPSRHHFTLLIYLLYAQRARILPIVYSHSITLSTYPRDSATEVMLIWLQKDKSSITGSATS